MRVNRQTLQVYLLCCIAPPLSCSLCRPWILLYSSNDNNRSPLKTDFYSIESSQPFHVSTDVVTDATCLHVTKEKGYERENKSCSLHFQLKNRVKNYHFFL